MDVLPHFHSKLVSLHDHYFPPAFGFLISWSQSSDSFFGWRGLLVVQPAPTSLNNDPACHLVKFPKRPKVGLNTLDEPQNSQRWTKRVERGVMVPSGVSIRVWKRGPLCSISDKGKVENASVVQSQLRVWCVLSMLRPSSGLPPYSSK